MERENPACYEIIKLCMKMSRVLSVESVDAAPIGLYTKLRKTRTVGMGVMQKLHIGKLLNRAYIISITMVACTNIT